MSEEFEQNFIQVAPEELSSTALLGLIEAFVLREGTDYGVQEYDLTQKVNHVRRQLDSDEIVIVYNLSVQSADLLTRAEFERVSSESANQ
ncbi:MAG: YheU family protein [Pseudomonadota bacterium]